MDVLVLGGTAWLGRATATEALARGHRVTCLARGDSGPVADGATLVAADRSRPDAYDAVRGRDWDAVVEVSWQPGFVRDALEAVGGRARHVVYVSSGNVYPDTAVTGTDESEPLLPALASATATREDYGPAKVACEQAASAHVGDRLLVARCGLIGGPGDPSDRAGYWVARAARAPHEPLLVPAEQDCPTQVADVRDLATWFVDSAERGVTGVVNAVGPTQPFAQWLAVSREIGGHTGPVVEVPGADLVAAGVGEFMGEESLAVWLADPAGHGFAARSGAAARALGLSTRPLPAVLTDVLADERARGLDRPRRAGLSAPRERDLIARFGR